MHVADFVGGVAYKLAERGDIQPDMASPGNVSVVCYELGRIVGYTQGRLESMKVTEVNG
jgi:hypothetical protein